MPYGVSLEGDASNTRKYIVWFARTYEVSSCVYNVSSCLRVSHTHAMYKVSLCLRIWTASFWIKKFIVIFVTVLCQFFLLKCFLLKSHIKYHLLVSQCSFKFWFLRRTECITRSAFHAMWDIPSGVSLGGRRWVIFLIYLHGLGRSPNCF